MNEMELQERKSFLTQAEAYLKRNELPAVLDLAEARLKRTPGDLDARIAICRVRLLQGRPDEAREMLSEMEDVLTERLNGIEELHATDAEGDAEIPSDFETVTLAELYIRQGHLRLAEELLEKIIGHDPQDQKAAELLQEVHERLLNGASAQQDAAVVAELSRWLDNIGRLRAHAA